MKDIVLDKAFQGLKGEVVDLDIYRLRDLQDVVSINDPSYVHLKGHKSLVNFKPDVIFDLGANIGLFTKYCRDLFPKVKIVSVEPDSNNFARLTETVDNDNNCICINKAIGQGSIYRALGAANGSGECYLSKGLGYENADQMQSLVPTEVTSMQVSDLNFFVRQSDKYIVKMDIEGGENTVFDHPPSVDFLLNSAYFTCEIHWFASTAQGVEEVRKKTLHFFSLFEKTHNCILDNCYFYAVKKSL